MIKRLPTHVKDDTCAAAVIAGDFIFLAHHSGSIASAEAEQYDGKKGYQPDIVQQTRVCFDHLRITLENAGASLDDVVQLNYYIRNKDDFRTGADVFAEYFTDGAPARMTVITDFIDEECLCQIDGVAYKG
ncbi:RidA family protein [Culicoidibacter larvae]|uniref:RidA family protein n=1 Tax=Culicoidibacter larvae TaxID=2579976 RepID=A0A5R8QEV3_9FIRM|nr:RidA family protein [Culicoidibacter larvae]TLG76559.1 RidA family protein [Culicoidibacter larvae]